MGYHQLPLFDYGEYIDTNYVPPVPEPPPAEPTIEDQLDAGQELLPGVWLTVIVPIEYWETPKNEKIYNNQS